MKRRHEEDDLQKICVRWFKIQHPQFILFAIPNAGKRNVVEGRRLKEMGLISGVPDLFLAMPSRSFNGMFIEMKSGKGRLTQNQKDIKILLEKEGYLVETCRSFEEFKEMIDNYLEGL